MAWRKQEILRHFSDAHWAVDDPEFLDLLATWRVQDKQLGFDVTPPAEWERLVLTQQWVDACYKIPDGMYQPKAREEAYKERDRVFRKATMFGKIGRKAIDDLIQKLHIIDDRVRGAATIFNTRAILAIEQDRGVALTVTSGFGCSCKCNGSGSTDNGPLFWHFLTLFPGWEEGEFLVRGLLVALQEQAPRFLVHGHPLLDVVRVVLPGHEDEAAV